MTENTLTADLTAMCAEIGDPFVRSVLADWLEDAGRPEFSWLRAASPHLVSDVPTGKKYPAWTRQSDCRYDGPPKLPSHIPDRVFEELRKVGEFWMQYTRGFGGEVVTLEYDSMDTAYRALGRAILQVYNS